MKNINLRPAELERDFGELAVLFTNEQDEKTSEPELKVDYEAHKERIFRLMVAEDEQGELLGFNWATRSRFDANRAYFYVIVKPEQRRQGAGRLLYEDVEQAARGSQVKELEITIRDNCPEIRAFAERRGFTKRSHTIAMELDLDAFDDQLYEEHITRLKGEGFQFTSMEELGDTEEARRKLYELNEMTSMEIPGNEGQRSWLSFDDFQMHVCDSSWYKPAGQMVVVDPATGSFAAMSAITRFAGTDYAYNLHTGVDKNYRGRKLGQAVKVQALRFAREVLKVSSVHTHHVASNAPMIAIDGKFGYIQAPGTFLMEKMLSD